MKKTILTIVLTAVICFSVVGVTFAFLADRTDPIVNTFTVGNVDITLTETTGNEYKLIPGHTYTKDPTVTVKANSEACWLFVKVEPANNAGTYITYSVDTSDGNWTKLANVDNVYYRQVAATSADVAFTVLTENEVVVNNLTKAQLDEFTRATDPLPLPTLTFTAYAVQQDGLTVDQAWEQANNAANYPADTTT